MPRKSQHGKRNRSPGPAEPSSRGRALGLEPCQVPCGCLASREVRRLEARVAELEAELQRKTALLTDDFHDEFRVRKLRCQIESDNDDDTYAAVTLRAAWRKRISDAFVKTIREVEETGMTASYSIRPCYHRDVGVSSRVALPFLPRDVVFVGAGGLSATICVNAPALVQIDALEQFFADAQRRRVASKFDPDSAIIGIMWDLCAARLPTSGLTRLLALIEALGEDQWPAVPLYRAWCELRLGRLSFTAFVSVLPHGAQDPDCILLLDAQVLCNSDVALEFFLPAAAQCSLDQIWDFLKFLGRVRTLRLDTVQFRDSFFTRLANTPGVDAKSMTYLSAALEHMVTHSPSDKPTVFVEPKFVFDWVVRSLPFCNTRRVEMQQDHVRSLCTIIFITEPKTTWPVSLIRSARDSFLIPAANLLAFEHAFVLALCLHATIRDSAAAWFCTAQFRDRFFITFFEKERGQPMSVCATQSFAHTLARITGAVSREERQEVFGTEAFCDQVISRMVRFARGNADAITYVRSAFLSVAENEDGSLHDVFLRDECRTSVLEPLLSWPLSSEQLFEHIRAAQT